MVDGSRTAAGAYQGVKDALVDIGVLPESDFATTYPAVNSVAAIAAVAPETSASATEAADELTPAVAADVGSDPSWLSSGPRLALADLLG
jgi:hypothetical protein